MKIKSSKKKTGHILVALAPFILLNTEDEFMEYGYLYFHLNDIIKRNIKLFHKNWKDGKSRVVKFPIPIYNAVLIRGSLVENADNHNHPDYKHFKFDSLNHLESGPEFEENDRPYGIDANILCYFDFFEIEVERIPDGYQTPLIIYRSCHYPYNKLI